MTKEIDDFLFGSPTSVAADTPAPISSPVASSSKTSTPAVPKPRAAEASMPSPEEIATPVVETANVMRKQMPPPEPPSVIGTLTKEISDNWKPIALTAAGMALLQSDTVKGTVKKGIRTIRDTVYGDTKKTPDYVMDRKEPVFATQAESELATAQAEKSRLQIANERFAAAQAAGVGSNPAPATAPAPAQPSPIQRQALQQTAGAPPFMSSAPKAPVPPTTSPAQAGPSTMTQAVTEGANPTQVVQKTVAETLDASAGKAHLNQINQSVLNSDEYKAIVAKFGEPTHVTGSGMPAWGGQGEMTLDEIRAAGKRLPKGGEFADLSKVPKGSAFVPGAQYYDSLAQAAHGRPNAQQIVRQTGGYPASYEQAKQLGGEFAQKAGLPARDAAAGVKAPNTPGIFETVRSSGGKTATLGKVGTGALTLIPMLSQASEAVKRAEKGDYSLAKEFGFDLGTLATLGALFSAPVAAAGSALMGGRSLNAGEEADLAKIWKVGSSQPARPTID